MSDPIRLAQGKLGWHSEEAKAIRALIAEIKQKSIYINYLKTAMGDAICDIEDKAYTPAISLLEEALKMPQSKVRETTKDSVPPPPRETGRPHRVECSAAITGRGDDCDCGAALPDKGRCEKHHVDLTIYKERRCPFCDPHGPGD